MAKTAAEQGIRIDEEEQELTPAEEAMLDSLTEGARRLAESARAAATEAAEDVALNVDGEAEVGDSATRRGTTG